MKSRNVEKEPLRLAPHKLEMLPVLSIVREDGERIEVPENFQLLLSLTQKGMSLASLAFELRNQQVARPFALLAKYVTFLYDSGLIVDRSLIALAESLRPDYEWNESIAFEKIASIEVASFSASAPANAGAQAIVLLLAGGAAAVSALTFAKAPIKEWAEIANAWPILIAFIFTFATGRTLHALLQAAIQKAFTGGETKIDFRIEPVSIALTATGFSQARANGPAIAISLVNLATLTAPVMLAPFFFKGTAPATFVTYFALLLLLSELSPFRQSALTEILRAFYGMLDRESQKKLSGGAESTVRTAHMIASALWVLAFVLFATGPLWKLIVFVKGQFDFSSRAVLVSTAVLLLSQAVILVSFVDDLFSGLTSHGSDFFSVRRLWRRKKSALAAVQAGGEISQSELDELPMLRQLDPKARAALLKHSRTLQVSKDFTLCREGDRDRTLFIVLSGQLAVGKRASGGRRKIVAVLGPGSVFGEIAFFMNEKRTADVFAIEEAEVLAIGHRESIADLSGERAEDLKTRTWFLQSLVSSTANSFFKELPADALDALAFAGKRKTYRAGEKVFSEGERADACYFIVQGKASVVQNMKTINKLEAGDAFGEIALLKPGLLRTAGVTADSELMTVRIEGDLFWGLLCEHLPLAVEIERLAERRLRQDQARAQK